MERLGFENECYYHIYNRGTDKRQIFYDEQDYYRFIHYLYICNDVSPVHIGESDVVSSIGRHAEKSKREELVDIVAYALMPNHFHLLLRQRCEKGISKFMQKLATGYAMYFNVKNKRTGALFQGRFKSKLVDSEQYLPALVKYIHLNPLGLLSSYNTREAEDYLRDYRWSSYRDYLGEKNFKSVLVRKMFGEIFKDADEHKEFIIHDIKKKTDETGGECLAGVGDLAINEL